MKPYIELTKPRITWLILMSTGIGYFFGLRQLGVTFDWMVLLHMLVGTGLMTSGTAALNQWYERVADGKMMRTKLRPLPSGQISSVGAFWFGVALSLAGYLELGWGTNWLTANLGLFTLSTYLFIYTPLKQRSPHSTTVGAVPGAMPPLMGFAAAALALVPVSLLPVALSMTGWLYFAMALGLGGWFVYASSQMRTKGARSVLLTSVMYLPLLYVALLAGCTATGKTASRTLPDLYAVPQFAFTNEQGQAFSSNALKGHVWVADFIFTECTGPCPRLSTLMSKVQAATPTAVKMVSFTVDPANDLPPVLAAYGKRYGAQPGRWTFLTGDPADLKRVRQDAFKLGEMDSSLNHSTRVVLVDQELRIRGFYDSNDPDVVAKLAADIKLLTGE
ncbi:MAG: UbiA family prenyltransferase [Acidobacteria bacterium]|nr:UbiA family prenyltransferase [Acidobacteriota bacterium]